MMSSLFGRRRARSCVFLLGTMRSLSPLATRTGCLNTERSAGFFAPHRRSAFNCACSAATVISLSRSSERSFMRCRNSLPAPIPAGVLVKNRNCFGSWPVSKPRNMSRYVTLATLLMPSPPAGPVPVMIILRTSCGFISTISCAIIPPIEKPNRSTWSSPMASMKVMASLAISSIDAAGAPLDAPTPRLSNVITRCFVANPSTTRGSQLSRTAARWMRKTTGVPELSAPSSR